MSQTTGRFEGEPSVFSFFYFYFVYVNGNKSFSNGS
jgi:hypothetical protein